MREGLASAGHGVIDVRISKEGRWREGGKDVELKPGDGLLGSEVVFPVLHGPNGEDGTVQGLLQVLDVPYVGAGVLGSAVCMNKVTFKELMANAGLPQVAYERLRVTEWKNRQDELTVEVRRLGFPLFVKPARTGSSIGISKVDTEADLAAALEKAFAEDSLALAEAAAPGLEVECSVIGSGELTISQPGEIVIDADWYDYEAKYTEGKMRLQIPARISEQAARQVREIAETAYRESGCAGMARVDFFVDGEQVLLNEINTIPGFTPTSVFGKLLEASGIPYPDMLNRLLEDAVSRFRPA